MLMTLCFRMGMRVQRKLNYPNDATTCDWRDFNRWVTKQ